MPQPPRSPKTPSAARGGVNFDVLVGERRIAVEVTRRTDATLMRLYSALGKQHARAESTKLPVVQATSRWSVWLQRTARVDRLSSRLDSLLAAVEKDKVWVVSSLEGGGARASDGRIIPTPSSVRSLVTAGVNHALRWSDVHVRPAIDLLPPFMSAWENVDAPAQAVEAEITANIGKLRSAEADEKHLFVWAHGTDIATLEGIASKRIAEARAPALPDDLDAVWIAAMHGPQRGAVWRCDRGGRWMLVQGPTSSPNT